MWKRKQNRFVVRVSHRESVAFVADEELVGEGGGDVEEDNVSYIISSEVHFTNPKINRWAHKMGSIVS